MARSLSGVASVWEQRRFWRHDTITVMEWWRGGTRAGRAPRPAEARRALTVDYCEAHYIRIYPDLPCPYCQEQPRTER